MFLTTINNMSRHKSPDDFDRTSADDPRRYRTVIDANDAHENFLRIRDQRLWWEREQRLDAERAVKLTTKGKQ